MRTHVLGLVLAAVAAACSNSPAEERFVGEVEGTDAVVALVRTGDRAALYLCGGADTFDSLTQWFIGRFDSEGNLELSKNEWTLRASILSDRLVGQITAPDWTEPIPLDAGRIAADGVAGLYHNAEIGCRTGVVVLPGDPDPWTQGTYCDDAGNSEQVTPAHPGVLDRNGFDVQVGERVLHVTPMLP